MSVYPARRSGLVNGATDKEVHAKLVPAQAQVKVYQQTFTSPGTWTWPGICTNVQVLVVSGGGAGSTSLTTPAPVSTEPNTYAGGGGVGVFDVPVSGPVPVTVGAGGVAVVATPTLPAVSSGGSGGTSAFGPISPPIPGATAYIEGGLGAGVPAPTHPYFFGGGAGSTVTAPGPGISAFSQRTKFSQSGVGPAWGSSAGDADPADPVGNVRFSYGAGARAVPAGNQAHGRGQAASGALTISQSQVVQANTGHAGQSGSQFNAAVPITVSAQGMDGSSGIVIVRWVE